MSQVPTTNSVIAAKFALQMAEQARKFGQRLQERRLEIGFKHQKDLVVRMHELGDAGLNTQQMSRYETGQGPLPREGRLEAFAAALETNVADLLAGPKAERKAQGPAPDPFADRHAKRLAHIERMMDKILKRLEPTEEPGSVEEDLSDAGGDAADAETDDDEPGHTTQRPR